MKKMLLIIFLSLLAAAGSSLRISLNTGGNNLRCSPSDGDTIRLEISIGEILADEKGHIRLPDRFDPYASSTDKVPSLSFHVALGISGNYLTRISEHKVQTELSYVDNRNSDSTIVIISKTYWLRDLRGIDVTVYPLRSVQGKLEISDRISVEFIRQKGSAKEAQKSPKLNPYFVDIYKEHFINFTSRYEDIAEYGSMAVICPTTSNDVQTQQFRGLIQPWVDWKNQKGIPTTVYSTAIAGSSYDEIRDFIQNLYDNDPNLTFVQLVGDFCHIPCNVATLAGNTGGMDAFYTLLKGDDWYPDIFVGRFSAETATDLYTQIKRSLDYEKGITSGSWLGRAAGVCSNNPPIPGDDDEHNWDHLDNIRAQLLDYGYSQVDRIYANEGADTQDLIDSLNEGKSLVNYCGEGYTTHWVAPEFGISDAENLANTDMLPFVHTVSCWTGQFYSGTCLAEALMRSRDPTATEARGAIAVYAAAPEQGISPPMEAQDHAMQLLVSGTKNTIGGLCYNGSCSMIDEYGNGGVYNFLAWNLFGDVSLSLRTKPALPIDAILPIDITPYSNNLDIDAGSPDILVSLSQNGLNVTRCFSDANGMAQLVFPDPPVPGDAYLLTLSGIDRIPLQRPLVCQPEGAHAILALSVQESGQMIEPEVLITKTILVQNLGSGTAQGVNVFLQETGPFQYIVPVSCQQFWGDILPGETKTAELSFKVKKGTPDMATLQYSVLTNITGYELACDEVVHAPTIVLEDVRRSPQPNWINPGDVSSVIIRLRNVGSVALKDLTGNLIPDSNFLQIVPPETDLTIDPGGADSLVFSAALSSACPVSEIIANSLHLDALNGSADFSWPWLATPPGITVESFESNNLQVFPWVYQSDQWSCGEHSLDGVRGLCSQAVAADSVCLELSFYSLREGDLRFNYELNRDPDCHDIWSFRINQSPLAELAESASWEQISFSLKAGQNTICWVGKRDPASASFGSCLWLDMISFPAGTLFDNAQLQADVSQMDITLAPGEIRKLPITLASADGKCLQYSAVIQRSEPHDAAKNDPRLKCNKSAFEAGAEELFLFTLYNTIPPGSLTGAFIFLPDNVLATQATGFTGHGQLALAFSGQLGSMSKLSWESETGSVMDSLLAGVRLVSDAGLEALELPYQINFTDVFGYPSESEGLIRLVRSDSLGACIQLAFPEGEIQDDETAQTVISANQNLMNGAQESYTLKIFYNATHLLSIPVNVFYDSDPPGFYDTPHLSGYPNPLRDHTTFAYSVPEDGRTELTIFNLRGQKVRTLVSDDLAKGYYRTAWDATDSKGKRVGSGIYFCSLKTPAGMSKTIKCVVLK